MSNPGPRNDPQALAGVLERLRLEPLDVDLLRQACELSLALGQPRPAANLARRLVRGLPGQGLPLFTLGRALYDLKDWPGAANAFMKAVALDAGDATAKACLARALDRQGRQADALRLALEVLGQDGLTAATLLLLGELLGDLGQFGPAREACARALAAEPGAEPHRCLAASMTALKDFDGALEHHRLALELEPANPNHLGNLGSDLLAMGDAQAGLQLLDRALELEPARRDLAASYHRHSDLDAALTHERHFRQGTNCLEQAYPSLAPASAPAFDRNPERKLRIGYVSPHFRGHAMMHWLPALLEARDRERFSAICFAENTLEDEWTRRCRSQADGWFATAGLTAQAIATTIAKHKVDILVDLAGPRDGNRLDVFARKPAPVQVAMLGFDRSTGLRTMDWRLTTPLADPPGEADPWTVERIWRLDGCFSYRPPQDAPEVGDLPALGRGGLNFGFLGSPFKVGPDFLQAAGRLLRDLPEARLHLLLRNGAEEAHKAFKLAPLIAAGVDPRRVVFHPGQAAFLATYQELDIMLDSFPADTATTVCESLWMGVPVLVLDRPQALRHTGRALVTQAGLGDWVAADLNGWLRIARRWSADLDGLAALRAGLRHRFAGSPLCDPAGSMRAIEAAYRGIWQDACRRT
jgi:protein O-GlcNAc transferase